jgi:acyl-CoA reductase-like NAD-dependent aldehyde dehydrogenase
MAEAAKTLTPCVFELGGKSPVIVDENVDIEVWYPHLTKC